MNGEELLSMNPDILLSLVNMKLRDYYDSIESLCEDLNISVNDITLKLKTLGYQYNSANNQFVPF